MPCKGTHPALRGGLLPKPAKASRCGARWRDAKAAKPPRLLRGLLLRAKAKAPRRWLLLLRRCKAPKAAQCGRCSSLRRCAKPAKPAKARCGLLLLGRLRLRGGKAKGRGGCGGLRRPKAKRGLRCRLRSSPKAPKIKGHGRKAAQKGRCWAASRRAGGWQIAAGCSSAILLRDARCQCQWQLMSLCVRGLCQWSVSSLLRAAAGSSARNEMTVSPPQTMR